jgi:light-regulated signal transduction histidine kinase (bacteriophytochrome)
MANKYQQDDRRVAETGEIFQCIEMNRVGEHTRHMEVRKSAVRDVDDKIIGVQVIFWDVSQREKALAALERSNRDLDDFVAIVSHDLHAPIRAVASYCELLQHHYQDELDETAEEYIGQATSGVKRMQRLISDLRSYSRVTRKAKNYVSIECEAALADALANLETEIRESGAKITHDPLPTVTADATQMMQLFQNLIGNGIKYRKNPTPEIHVSAEKQEGYWQFAISDNGIGMDLNKSKGIFRLFYRLHSDEAEYLGTGIGLATCKRIVERIGGSIWVKSEPAEGSVFFFSIPISR